MPLHRSRPTKSTMKRHCTLLSTATPSPHSVNASMADIGVANREANLSGARIGLTVFGGVDLSQTYGLDTCISDVNVFCFCAILGRTREAWTKTRAITGPATGDWHSIAEGQYTRCFDRLFCSIEGFFKHATLANRV